MRTYVKKTDREFDPAILAQAVSDVIEFNMSIRASANKNKVKKSTVANYVKKARENGILKVCFKPDFKTKQVFSDRMEMSMQNYLLKCSAMFYGLTPRATRRLAYEYGLANNIKMPESWERDKSAGPDWLSAFIKRNPTLSIRTPEATSLARMTSFNKTTVNTFFDKLAEVMERYSFKSNQIFNLDEVIFKIFSL